jgi:hypothetical protein
MSTRCSSEDPKQKATREAKERRAAKWTAKAKAAGGQSPSLMDKKRSIRICRKNKFRFCDFAILNFTSAAGSSIGTSKLSVGGFIFEGG